MKKLFFFVPVVTLTAVFVSSHLHATSPKKLVDSNATVAKPAEKNKSAKAKPAKVEPRKKSPVQEIKKAPVADVVAPPISKPKNKEQAPVKVAAPKKVEPQAKKVEVAKPKASPKPVSEGNPKTASKAKEKELKVAENPKPQVQEAEEVKPNNLQGNKPTNEAKPRAVAAVNGQPIGAFAFETLLLEQLRNGTRDSVDLRKNIRDELVIQTLLSQLAMEEGLDQSKEVNLAFESARRTILSQAWRQNWARENPVTQDEIQKEYNATVKRLGNTEYQLRQVVVADETAAFLIVDQMEAGKSLGELASKYTIESGGKKSKGLLPWVSPSLLLPPLGDLIPNAKEGDLLDAPVRTQAGWHIVKVEGVRKLKPPSLEQLQSQVKQGILQKKMTQEIQKLLDKAKIEF
jgi:peptidyl-prolyl cis-trans isomerase C